MSPMEAEDQVTEKQNGETAEPSDTDTDSPKKKRKSNAENKEGKIKKTKAVKGEKSGKVNGSNDANTSSNSLQKLSKLFSEVVTKDTSIESFDLTVGFVCLDEIGLELLKHLVKSNQNIIIWNENSEILENYRAENVIPAKSLIELVMNSDIIFLCTHNEASVKDLFYGHLAFRRRLHNKYIINLTSCGPESLVSMHDTVADEGGYYLAARLQGNLSDAQESSLEIFASGDYEAFDKAKPSFQAFAKNTYYCNGNPGSASALSIASNVLAGLSIAALSQACKFKTSEKPFTPEEREVLFLNPFSPVTKSTVEAVLSTSSTTSTASFQTIREDMVSFLYSNMAGKPVPKTKLLTCTVALDHLNFMKSDGQSEKNLHNETKPEDKQVKEVSK